MVMAVLGICRTRWVVRPRYKAAKPSSLGTVLSVWKKDLYLVPSSRNLVRMTSARSKAKGGRKTINSASTC